MVMIELSEQDLKDITVALVEAYMNLPKTVSVDSEYKERCGALHDRIQVVRRKLELEKRIVES